MDKHQRKIVEFLRHGTRSVTKKQQQQQSDPIILTGAASKQQNIVGREKKYQDGVKKNVDIRSNSKKKEYYHEHAHSHSGAAVNESERARTKNLPQNFRRGNVLVAERLYRRPRFGTNLYLHRLPYSSNKSNTDSSNKIQYKIKLPYIRWNHQNYEHISAKTIENQGRIKDFTHHNKAFRSQHVSRQNASNLRTGFSPAIQHKNFSPQSASLIVDSLYKNKNKNGWQSKRRQNVHYDKNSLFQHKPVWQAKRPGAYVFAHRPFDRRRFQKGLLAQKTRFLFDHSRLIKHYSSRARIRRDYFRVKKVSRFLRIFHYGTGKDGRQYMVYNMHMQKFIEKGFFRIKFLNSDGSWQVKCLNLSPLIVNPFGFSAFNYARRRWRSKLVYIRRRNRIYNNFYSFLRSVRYNFELFNVRSMFKFYNINLAAFYVFFLDHYCISVQALRLLLMASYASRNFLCYFFSCFERRLLNVLVHLKLVLTCSLGARPVKDGFVKVNGEVIYNTNFVTRFGDIVELEVLSGYLMRRKNMYMFYNSFDMSKLTDVNWFPVQHDFIHSRRLDILRTYIEKEVTALRTAPNRIWTYPYYYHHRYNGIATHSPLVYDDWDLLFGYRSTFFSSRLVQEVSNWSVQGAKGNDNLLGTHDSFYYPTVQSLVAITGVNKLLYARYIYNKAFLARYQLRLRKYIRSRYLHQGTYTFANIEFNRRLCCGSIFAQFDPFAISNVVSLWGAFKFHVPRVSYKHRPLTFIHYRTNYFKGINCKRVNTYRGLPVLYGDPKLFTYYINLGLRNAYYPHPINYSKPFLVPLYKVLSYLSASYKSSRARVHNRDLICLINQSYSGKSNYPLDKFDAIRFNYSQAFLRKWAPANVRRALRKFLFCTQRSVYYRGTVLFQAARRKSYSFPNKQRCFCLIKRIMLLLYISYLLDNNAAVENQQTLNLLCQLLIQLLRLHKRRMSTVTTLPRVISSYLHDPEQGALNANTSNFKIKEALCLETSYLKQYLPNILNRRLRKRMYSSFQRMLRTKVVDKYPKFLLNIRDLIRLSIINPRIMINVSSRVSRTFASPTNYRIKSKVSRNYLYKVVDMLLQY